MGGFALETRKRTDIHQLQILGTRNRLETASSVWFFCSPLGDTSLFKKSAHSRQVLSYGYTKSD